MTDPFNFSLDSPFNPAFEFSLYDKPENNYNNNYSLTPITNLSPLPLESLPSLQHQPSTEFPFDMDIELGPEEILFNEKFILPSEENRKYQEEFVIQETIANEEAFQYYDLFDEIPPKKTIRITIEIDDDIYELLQKNAQKPAEEEDTTSVSTKETVIGVTHNKTSCSFEVEGSFQDVENEWHQALKKFAQKRPADERNYLKKIAPHVMGSLKEAIASHQKPMDNSMMFESIISELLYGKEIQINRENQLLMDMVKNEVERIQAFRPLEDSKKMEKIKKKKKQEKNSGKKVHSVLNHMNENFVSNVFRFAKDNYPGDKELHKFASERGVSAVNFRNLTTAKLDDGILVRKAKVRLIASGKELVTNIEAWMMDGYFENCEDGEKYIQYKQKAVTNLALDRT